MPEVVGLHHAALTVRDIDNSSRWYVEILGAEEVFRDNDEHRRTAVLRFPGTDPVLGLVEHLPDQDGDDRFDPTTIGLDQLALSVARRSDLDDWAEHFADHGVAHSGIAEIPPGATINLEDPDGIALVLFWDRFRA